MSNDNLLKTARQMIDDLINDDPESAKTNFHDFLTAKTVAKLNPDMVAASEEDETEISDDDDPSVGSEDFSDDDDESEENEDEK